MTNPGRVGHNEDSKANLDRALRELRMQLRRTRIVSLSRMTLSRTLTLAAFAAAADQLIREGHASPDAELEGVIRYGG